MKIGARLEHSLRKSLRCFAQGTRVSLSCVLIFGKELGMYKAAGMQA
jgi:hypothetical protein